MHQGHRQRLKSRFLAEGFSSFAPHEVLELLLFYVIPQKDVNPIAHNLLNRFGSLEGVFSAEKAALMTIKGIGEQAACYLMLFKPLFQYYQLSKLGEKPCLSTRKSLFAFCVSLLEPYREEVFYILSLDKNMVLIRATLLAKGSSDQVPFTFREILQEGLQTGAHSIVLCHNHPAGSLLPSTKDIEMTKEISYLLEKTDIFLADHIIVANSQAASIGHQ